MLSQSQLIEEGCAGSVAKRGGTPGRNDNGISVHQCLQKLNRKGEQKNQWARPHKPRLRRRLIRNN